jgi:hypothetical protein
VSVSGVVGASAVAAAALYQGIHIGRLRARSNGSYDLLALLPLVGLFLIGLSAASQELISAEPLSAEAASAPVILGGLYLFLLGLSVRGWGLAGVERAVFSPRDSEKRSPLVVGERITLQPGMVVPVDARVTSGSVALQERYLSPESRFRVRDETEIVFAGSSIIGGKAEAVALAQPQDSCLARLEAAVSPELDGAQMALAQSDAQTGRYVGYAMLFCSVSAGIFWNERGAAPSSVLFAAGLVLFSAALGLSADIVYSSFARLVRQWATRGFVLLRGDSCESLAQVKEVAFDPSVVGVTSLCQVRSLELLDDRINREALCTTLASLLGRADDAAFAAVGDYCASVAGPSLEPQRVIELHEYDGWGVSGALKGVEFSIGSEGFLVERGIMIQPTDSEQAVKANERVVLVAIDSDVIARFTVAYGQRELVEASAEGDSEERSWSDSPDTVAAVATLEQRDLAPNLLLVRGEESIALGRQHSLQVAPLSKDSLRPPQGTVLSLTSNYAPLAELLRDCREHRKWALLCRTIIAAAGVFLVASVFVGLKTVIVPVVVLSLITLLVLL